MDILAFIAAHGGTRYVHVQGARIWLECCDGSTRTLTKGEIALLRQTN